MATSSIVMVTQVVMSVLRNSSCYGNSVMVTQVVMAVLSNSSCYGNSVNRHGNSSCHVSATQLKLLWQQRHGNSSCHGNNIPSSWSRPWGGVSIQLELVRCCDGNMKSSLLVHRLNVCRALFHHRPETKCKYSSCIFTWYFWFGCLGQLRPHSRTAIQVQNIVNRTFHRFFNT